MGGGAGIEQQKSLQSICYKRGSLQLLDQRKLPLETIYLDVRDSQDGWVAIKDMVVRGAPAIAISAALSLAVEVSSLGALSGTPNDAASFLSNKLDYLVSSRPTAVNLSDAAMKLKEVVHKAAATASDAQTVYQTYIEAAEDMLDDDVASNKAIGHHGASLLQKQANSNSLSVLTHCNTGSLATAGYGTALGVIRALHEKGVLGRAYCTETRPFNQGSRLTAFELVHDNIPATLVADSAAAALMKTGQVNAVVVGADRVAANGDTANKIGTYSLALSAKHHGIPFYVAAPLTSVDLSISCGEEIVIEERSAKELLNARGGLGEQVAASGIAVWNPAFDVTPATIITGIITEKGVVTKNGSDSFDIKSFTEELASNLHSPAVHISHRRSAASRRRPSTLLATALRPYQPPAVRTPAQRCFSPPPFDPSRRRPPSISATGCPDSGAALLLAAGKELHSFSSIVYNQLQTNTLIYHQWSICALLLHPSSKT